MLRVAVAKFGGRNWKAISGHVPGRNHVQCLQRWRKVLAPGLVKGSWSQEEDSRLLNLVQQGMKNWGEAAALIPGRTAKQCRERWKNHLDPSINKGPWQLEEDKALMSHYEELGQRWAAISKRLPGRTENAVKIRYKSLSRQAEAGQLDWLKAAPVAPAKGTSKGKGRGRGRGGSSKGKGRGRGRGKSGSASGSRSSSAGRPRAVRAGSSSSAGRAADPADDEESSPVKRRNAALALAQLPDASVPPAGLTQAQFAQSQMAGDGQLLQSGTDVVYASGGGVSGLSVEQLTSVLRGVNLQGTYTDMSGPLPQQGSMGMPGYTTSGGVMPLGSNMGMQMGHVSGPMMVSQTGQVFAVAGQGYPQGGAPPVYVAV